MQNAAQANDEQATYWNGSAGHAWVEMQSVLDQMFEPFTAILLEDASPSTWHVLDVGCGAGDTTLSAAKSLGTHGRATGIDVSAPLIDAARQRAERQKIDANFLCADAADYAFSSETFDFLISRFGVMFFGDPVRAFENLHRASRQGAELRFIVWRTFEENPYMMTAERAARAFLPNLPPRQPNTPGQFAFADQNRVVSILSEARWSSIALEPIDIECAYPEKELTRYFTSLGPLGKALREVQESERSEIVKSVRAAFDPFVFGDEVRFKTACWLIKARKR